MNTKEYETYKNFINSNTEFLAAISSLRSYKLDIYIKIELLILYIKLRCNNQLPTTNQDIIKKLFDASFYIEDDHIIIDNNKYTFETLYNIARSLIYKKNIKEPTPIRYHTYLERSSPDSHCKIINISRMLIPDDYTLKERAYILERTCRVDSVTLPYIKEMNSRFKDLIDYLFKCLLNNNIDIDEDYYYKILGVYLKLYPFIDYANEKIAIPYESIDLPLFNIGLVKVKYHDPYLDTLKVRINELSHRIQKLSNETEILIAERYIVDQRVITRRNNQIIAYNSELAATIMEYNEYSHNPQVINTIFFKYIYEAFTSGNVIINDYFADPVLKLFTIDKNEVTSFIAIHLNTLLETINPSLLSQSTKKLEYTAN